MKKIVGIGLYLTALAPSIAHANPFNFDQGDGRVILSGSYTESPEEFDDHGHVYKAPSYDQTNIYAIGEYGLTDSVNILVTPSFKSIDLPGPGNDSTGLGYTDLGARYQVAKGRNWVFSVQALARIPGTGRNYGIAQIGNNEAQYDLRALGGYTFGQSGKTFVTLEGSYRLSSGAQQNESHVDFTIGTRVTPRLLLLASVYNTFSDGRGTGLYDYSYRYHDVYLTAVYNITNHVGLQLGATGTVAGRNALRQRGPVFGVWYTF